MLVGVKNVGKKSPTTINKSKPCSQHMYQLVKSHLLICNHSLNWLKSIFKHVNDLLSANSACRMQMLFIWTQWSFARNHYMYVCVFMFIHTSSSPEGVTCHPASLKVTCAPKASQRVLIKEFWTEPEIEFTILVGSHNKPIKAMNKT